MAAQQLLFDLWVNFMKTTIRSAKLTIDGVVHEKSILEPSIEGNVMKFYIYLDVESGIVSRAALLDHQGREVDVEEMNIEKTQDGQVIVFFYEFELSKRGVAVG